MLASRESEIGKSGDRCWQVGKMKSVSQGSRQVGKVKSVSQGSDVGKSGK